MGNRVTHDQLHLDQTFLPVGAVAPTGRPDMIRLAGFQARSIVAGPGQRAVVWVAGCLRRCPGCMKPEFFSFDAGKSVAVEELAARILAIPGLQGVTYSGGEPFEQAAALANLSRILKRSGLAVLIYSGYRIEALRATPERFGALLDEADLLIDGEYRRDEGGPQRWRGSENQRIHPLSARGLADIGSSHFPDCLTQEVQLSIEGELLRLSGFPDIDIERKLSERLASRGIEMRRDL